MWDDGKPNLTQDDPTELFKLVNCGSGYTKVKAESYLGGMTATVVHYFSQTGTPETSCYRTGLLDSDEAAYVKAEIQEYYDECFVPASPKVGTLDGLPATSWGWGNEDTDITLYSWKPEGYDIVKEGLVLLIERHY